MNAGIALLVASAVAHMQPDFGVPYPPAPLTNRIHYVAVAPAPSPRIFPAPTIPPIGANDYLWTMQESLDGGKTWVDVLKNLGGNQGEGGTWDFRDSITNRPIQIRYVRQTGWKK